ncbi:MAG TPA: chemotaxis protein CheB [Candidatus Limnocylindrales bacterium]|nr:chemotaxis protein CheB [Candidatus Limnocylindrales bacterium]
MAGHDIIVIGSSAGGYRTLTRLMEELPADLPAAIFVVQHLTPDRDTRLASLLQKNTQLTVETARDGGDIARGTVYVAPPDHHLLVHGGRIRTVRGPRENLHRPAVDVLFRSAAWEFGTRVIGVVLTGNLDDGSAGLSAIKTCGGLTVVQDPADALFPSMPAHALAATEVDHCVPLARMPQLLSRLARQPAPARDGYPVPNRIKLETQFAMLERDMSAMDEIGKPSELACPSCHGTLCEVDGENRFRCHTGHAFSLQSLAHAQPEAVEEALFQAVRALQETISVAKRVALGGWEPERKARQEQKIAEMTEAADTLRALLVGAAGMGIDASQPTDASPSGGMPSDFADDAR